MDFAAIMFAGLVVTGGVALTDRVLWAPKRRNRADELRRADTPDAHAIARAEREPLLVEYAKAFFPVILVVFLLRSFVVEPFRIPSASMRPTLIEGDFILVSKFTYGLRLPILDIKLMDIGSPARGDVMVFRYPHDTSMNYIKRVVGLPGDHIVYDKKRLYVNGKLVEETPDSDYTFEDAGMRTIETKALVEKLGKHRHDILLDPRRGQEHMEFDVPEGQYFVMGDNRDYSNDSRYWGYVPDRLIVGRAFLIWFSWNEFGGGGVNWGRLGTMIP
jgi:signal peptidase I